MKTLIIGGGLSGLALAEELDRRGDAYVLVESRDRFGGRVMTQEIDGACFDMGPAWFWPGQPRISALIDRLGLNRFDQYVDGILTIEENTGQVQRGRGHAAMQGSWRLEGGFSALTDALAARIPNERKRLSATVEAITFRGDCVIATLSNAETFEADKVVCALPPRLVAGLKITPALPPSVMQTLKEIPTWMAGQAKAMAVYDTAFWRDAGLSGNAMSRIGPMVEVHDASPVKGGPFALFGFIGLPPHARTDTSRLEKQVLEQFARLFGPMAARPKRLFIKDWAFDPHTAAKADHTPLYAHPTYRTPPALGSPWQGRLLFAGTEVAPEFGGLIEGALEAAENVANMVLL
jgi:monoamine oxidase